MKRKKILKQVELFLEELHSTGALSPERAGEAKRTLRALAAGLRQKDMKAINQAVDRLALILTTK